MCAINLNTNVSRETFIDLHLPLCYNSKQLDISLNKRERNNKMAKVIAVANQKGGVGKTTTAVNLSSCVAFRGKKVLLIDLDPQGNATTGLGVNKNKLDLSSYDVLINDTEIESVKVDTKQETLKLCPSSIKLAGAEVELVSAISRENKLKDAVENIKDKYDYIFVDCPPSLGLITLNALTSADAVLVPIQCEFYALEGLSQLMNTVQLVQKHLNKKLQVEGVVMTMFDARTNLSIEVVEEVRRHFGNKVYNTIIPRNIKLSEAPSYGLPIVLYDQNCKGSEAYLGLADEFIEVSERG